MNNIKKISNKKIVSINIIKVICAYMVVAIHTHPFEDINMKLSFIFTQIIPRIAVPFFFLSSGYFFIKALKKNEDVFKKYLNRLLITYSLWSLIYFVYRIVLGLKEGLGILEIIKEGIISYFIIGSWYHLWYFPAIIICVLVVYIFKKINSLKILGYICVVLYLIGVLGCSYYQIGIKIPILNILYTSSLFNFIRRIFLMGLPFFMLGYFIDMLKERIEKININIILKCLIAFIILFLLEIVLVINLNIQDNIIITLFLYPLTSVIFILCLKMPLDNLNVNNTMYNYIANLTYYAHPLVIIANQIVFGKIFGVALSQTPMFFLTIILTTMVSIIIYKLNIKWIICFIK